jgi:hypothetical protein
MILRDRVPFRVSWWGMIAVLLLGFLTLPGWSQSKKVQSKKETPEVQETESKDDVDVGLAEPAEGVDEFDELKVPAKPAVNTVILKSEPVEKAETASLLDLNTFILHKIDPANQNTARNRDRRLQEIEKKLQSLLEELRELRGKKDATSPPLPVTVVPGIKVRKGLGEIIRFGNRSLGGRSQGP